MIQILDEAIIVVQDNAISGTIRAGNEKYRLRSLDDSYQVLILIDEDAFPPEHPPGAYEELEQELNQKLASESLEDVLAGVILETNALIPEQTEFVDIIEDTALDFGKDTPQSDLEDNELFDDGSIANVLVAYTPLARQREGGVAAMNALIQLAIDETNQSYANSGIYTRLRLVRRYETDYDESSNMRLDRDRFRIRNDGFMDEVHGLRNQSAADLAILITGSGGYCGIASSILAEADTGFAIVRRDCATGYYSFGHEIGHLQGARHNPEADSTNTPFPFGHGYYYQPGSWRTIMSYNCPGNCTRRQFWSNPNINFGSVATGTFARNYNARVLNETASRIANFRTTGRRGELYQLHNNGAIWRYTDTPCSGNSCPGWQRLDNNPRSIAIATSGDQLYQLHNTGAIWRYTGRPCSGNSCPGWQRLDNNPQTRAIATSGGQLYQLHENGSIWRYTGRPCSGNSCPGWQRLDNNPRTIAIAASGGQLYQLHNTGSIWRYTGRPCSGNSCPGWQRLDNNRKTKAIAAAGDELYQLHNDGWIWRYTGTPCNGNSCPGWQRLDNNPRTVAIAAEVGQLYQLHNTGAIWRYTGRPCSGNSCPGWQRLDNNRKTTAITAAGDELYQLHNDGWIWRYTGRPCSGNSCPGWQRLDNNLRTRAIVAAEPQQ
ncbi:MAG: M12 family metallo-peptidase [Xenococcus sp. (in: cyanobacteria)]